MTQPNSPTALEACPFCGSDQLVVVSKNHGTQHFAECVSCWARGPVFSLTKVVRSESVKVLQDVVAKWNKRVENG